MTLQLMPEGSVGINEVNWGIRGRKKEFQVENICAKAQQHERGRNFCEIHGCPYGQRTVKI